jgi:hypothetical protein
MGNQNTTLSASDINSRANPLISFFYKTAIIIGLIFLAVLIYSSVKNIVFVRDSAVTTGTVISYESHQDSNPKNSGSRWITYYQPVINFTASNGQSTEFTSSDESRTKYYTIGDQVAVRYSKSNPSNATLDSFGSLWGLPITEAIFAALFLLAAFAVKRIGKRIKPN